jgi:hypothetical protein
MSIKDDLKSKPKNQLNLYQRIRKWIQPYWNPKPKKKKKPRDKSFSTRGKETELIFVESKRPLTRAFEFEKQPKIDECWTYHNSHLHQIWCHLAPGTGFRYTTDQRSNEERRLTNLCIRPVLKVKGSIHRTHMLPFGYHGLENDERLVIGWSGEANIGPFNEFEQKIKKLKEPIYWMCSVERMKYGARWRYIIFNEQMKMIDSLEHIMKTEFVWDDYRTINHRKKKGS